jgi:hypothetical protein
MPVDVPALLKSDRWCPEENILPVFAGVAPPIDFTIACNPLVIAPENGRLGRTGHGFSLPIYTEEKKEPRMKGLE